MSATTAHHGLPAHEVVLLLESDPYHGLSDGEAAQRLERFGPNTLAVVTRASLLARILRQFHHPLIYVLLVAGTITAGLKEFVDAAVIFGVVVINAIVGFIQESKAEAALQGLRSMVHTHAKVVREGHEHTMPSEELVPGDLVLLAAGDKVPADLRLVRQTGLSVNESALTGESTPVHKDEVALPEGTPVADRRNIAYSGTLVTAGHGAGIVVATGAETELGEIHRLVGAAEVVATPLTAKLAWFSKFLTIAILGLAALTFGVGLLRRQDAVETFTAAIALAVGAIPEGLPTAVTITLAIGMARMAKRRAVIRRLPAVETLGSTTVICADKTGTLTENQMTVQSIWTPHGEIRATGTGYAPDVLLCDTDDAPVPVNANAALRWSLLAVPAATTPHWFATAHAGRSSAIPPRARCSSWPPRPASTRSGWRQLCRKWQPYRSVPSGNTWPPCIATGRTMWCWPRVLWSACSTCAAPRWAPTAHCGRWTAPPCCVLPKC